MRYLADGFEKSAVLRLPPATLRFFYDQAFPELADIHQGLLPSLGSDRVLIHPRFCSPRLAQQLDGCVESFSECPSQALGLHTVPSVIDRHI